MLNWNILKVDDFMLFPSPLPSHFHITLAVTTYFVAQGEGNSQVNVLETRRAFSSLTAVLYLLFCTASSSKQGEFK